MTQSSTLTDSPAQQFALWAIFRRNQLAHGPADVATQKAESEELAQAVSEVELKLCDAPRLVRRIRAQSGRGRDGLAACRHGTRVTGRTS